MSDKTGPRRGTNKRAVWEWLAADRGKPATAEEVGAALYNRCSSCAGYMRLREGPHPFKTRWATRLLRSLLRDRHVERCVNTWRALP